MFTIVCKPDAAQYAVVQTIHLYGLSLHCNVAQMTKNKKTNKNETDKTKSEADLNKHMPL